MPGGALEHPLRPLDHLLVVAVEEVDHESRDAPGFVEGEGFFEMFAERLPMDPQADADAVLARVLDNLGQFDLGPRDPHVGVGARRCVTDLRLHVPGPAVA